MGSVTLRPNITEREEAWKLVPGDIVEQWSPDHMRADRTDATPLQREERTYYEPCVFCGRYVGRIKQEGPVAACEANACPERSRQPARRET